MGSLDGKITLTTGATSGIGVDITGLFVAEGHPPTGCAK
jgi:NADP-dependent 3-hydroxy acid dehydrogenase YdfG